MKRFFVIFALSTALFGGGRFFLGGEFKLNRNWQEITQMTGAHAGLYWGPFSLGGAAYTTITPVDFNFEQEPYTLNRLTYGGLDIRFMPESFGLVSVTANFFMGASLLAFEDESPIEEDLLLSVEPGVQLLINVTSSIRLGYGVTWRGNLDTDFKTKESLTGFSSSFIAQFGKLNL